jgi:DNA-binding NarL/FixJ family response regulator
MACATALHSGEEEIRVLVTDSAPLTGRLIADALLNNPGLTAKDVVSGTLVSTAKSYLPHVTLISAQLEHKSRAGLELLKNFRLAFPEARVVLLLDGDDRALVIEAFRSGARGVFCREDSVEMLVRCVRRVHDGQFWVYRQHLEYLLEALTRVGTQPLLDSRGKLLRSKREQQILRWLVQGYTNAQIASELNISLNAVEDYLFRIYDKLGVSGRVEAVLYTNQNVFKC